MAHTIKEKQAGRKELSRGAWTADEDQKLVQAIGTHGAKQWPTIAAKAGLNRCAKSCRLRWMNYLRPNIKRGNISDQEEDLIIRLHKLLGNRWSLIAARLPDRTDNEIKNYWNYHLSKKVLRQGALGAPGISTGVKGCSGEIGEEKKHNGNGNENENGNRNRNISISNETVGSESLFDVNDFFNFSDENLWVAQFLEFGNA